MNATCRTRVSPHGLELIGNNFVLRLPAPSSRMSEEQTDQDVIARMASVDWFNGAPSFNLTILHASRRLARLHQSCRTMFVFAHLVTVVIVGGKKA